MLAGCSTRSSRATTSASTTRSRSTRARKPHLRQHWRYAARDPVVALLFWFRRIPGGDLPLREFFPQLHLRPAISNPTAFVGLGDILGVTIAFGIWAVPLGPGGETRLATETRVHARDVAARRRFRFYWLAVGPFSALIRRRWLSAARRAAETGP